MEKYIYWLTRNLKKIAIFASIYFLIVIFNQEKVFGKPPIDKCPNLANPLDDNWLSYDQTECFIQNGYYAHVFQIDIPMTILSVVVLPIAIYKLKKLITD